MMIAPDTCTGSLDIPLAPSKLLPQVLGVFSSLHQKLFLFTWKTNVAMVSKRFNARPALM